MNNSRQIYLLSLLPVITFLICGLIFSSNKSFAELNNKENTAFTAKYLTHSEIQKTLDKGSEFLRISQNSDGSWGSARQTKGLNIFAPVPGSHQAFRLAVTALSISALLEIKDEDENYSDCIAMGQKFLMAKLPQLRRASPMAIYNIWSHCYGLQALYRMHEKSSNKHLRKMIKEVIRQQIFMLQKYESVDGGWGYYDFNVQTKQPSGFIYIFC